MDVARCTLDDELYQAVNFSALAPGELGLKRQFLVCDECGGPAFFRKAAKSGQAACFGARPHADDCSIPQPDSERNADGLGDDQDILANPGQLIVVDFDFGAQEIDRHNDPDAAPNPDGRGGRYVGGGPRPNAAMHRRLSTILRNLIASQQFRTSRQILDIPGAGQFAVADFFVPFDAISPEHSGHYRGYWGMIANAGRKDGSLWLNSGGKGAVSLVVSEPMVIPLCQRFDIDDDEDVAGAYALVFGTLRLAKKSQKKFVPVEDLGFMTMRLD